MGCLFISIPGWSRVALGSPDAWWRPLRPPPQLPRAHRTTIFYWSSVSQFLTSSVASSSQLVAQNNNLLLVDHKCIFNWQKWNWRISYSNYSFWDDGIMGAKRNEQLGSSWLCWEWNRNPPQLFLSFCFSSCTMQLGVMAVPASFFGLLVNLEKIMLMLQCIEDGQYFRLLTPRCEWVLLWTLVPTGFRVHWYQPQPHPSSRELHLPLTTIWNI